MMNIAPSNKLPRSHFPEDLIAEVLSWLPVKSLMRFSCVCKSWNTLFISDPAFIKLHRRRSALCRPYFFLQRWKGPLSFLRHCDFCVAHFSGLGIVENSCPSLVDDPGCYQVVGSCNGLICLHGHSFSDKFKDGWLCIWNPATRLVSGKLGSYRVKKYDILKWGFGYDPSTETYKVVKFVKINWLTNTTQVSVFTLGSNVWRDIQLFPNSLFPCIKFNSTWNVNEGVHLNGTINWIATCDKQKVITCDQYKILSLDLTTETNTLLLPPPGFIQGRPFALPTIGVLMDSLCFYHDFEETHFVIWQMKEFGVVESWSQLLKFSYQDLQLDRLGLTPLCISNSDTSILVSSFDDQVIILYNRRANTLERTTNLCEEFSWIDAREYVESLVPLY